MNTKVYIVHSFWAIESVGSIGSQIDCVTTSLPKALSIYHNSCRKAKEDSQIDWKHVNADDYIDESTHSSFSVQCDGYLCKVQIETKNI